MTESIIVALITGGIALAGNIITAVKQSQLLKYRMEQLEKKVDKHNHFGERLNEVEKTCEVHKEKIKVANNRLLDLERRYG